MKSMKKLVLASLALLVVMMVILPLVGCDTNAGGDKPSSTDTPTQQPSGEGGSGATQEPSGDGGNGATEGTKIKVPEMVSVTGGTIEGKLPDWWIEGTTPDSESSRKGVFIEGRTVTLSDFHMGKYEVTQEEYASVMAGQKVTVDGTTYQLESNPSYCTEDSEEYTLFAGDVQGKRPVDGVTWYDAVWYCNALSEKVGLEKAYTIEVEAVEQVYGKEGYFISRATVTLNKDANGYRLPTEAEWEYAARGGDPEAEDWNYTFSGANTLDAVGWYAYNNKTGETTGLVESDDKSGSGTHQVGKKAANRLGIYDMSGNVAEWCYDWYTDEYAYSIDMGEETDPQGPTSGSSRVYRGGLWKSRMAFLASVSYRDCGEPGYGNCGFRVVCPSSNTQEPSGDGTEEHKHRFADEWTYNGTHHWKEATCEHTAEKSEYAEHTFVNEVCSICNLRIPEGFVYIPEGSFSMGIRYADIKTVHEVKISKGFYMGKYEVTQKEYLEVMEKWGGTDEPSETYGKGDNYPAYYVSWYDALVYCNKRSLAEGLTPCYTIKNSTDPKDWGAVPTWSDSIWNEVICNWDANGYRLPTEAEWEYAARAGNGTTETLIWSGTDKEDELGNYAWYKINSENKTHEVGTKKPNAYGLYDVSGNVAEWCWDWYGKYVTKAVSDPTGASSGSSRVYRGGSWEDGSDNCAVSYHRYSGRPYLLNPNWDELGFRVVRASSK